MLKTPIKINGNYIQVPEYINELTYGQLLLTLDKDIKGLFKAVIGYTVDELGMHSDYILNLLSLISDVCELNGEPLDINYNIAVMPFGAKIKAMSAVRGLQGVEALPKLGFVCEAYGLENPNSYKAVDVIATANKLIQEINKNEDIWNSLYNPPKKSTVINNAVKKYQEINILHNISGGRFIEFEFWEKKAYNEVMMYNQFLNDSRTN